MRTERPGIIGHRSWIAKVLDGRLACSRAFTKERVGVDDYSDVSCLYLFAGRAHPNNWDAAQERMLVGRLMSLAQRHWPQRILYVSSRAAIGGPRDEYSRLKIDCEMALEQKFGDRLAIVRPGAVFGPGQDPESPMLIPMIGRKGDATRLATPDRPTTFIHVDRLVDHLVRFLDMGYRGEPDGSWNIPGSFVMTPAQMLSLWNTWACQRELSAGRPGSAAARKTSTRAARRR